MGWELGLPWPEPRLSGVGRPWQQARWESPLFRAIAGDRLPPNTPREAPSWYRGGQEKDVDETRAVLGWDTAEDFVGAPGHGQRRARR